jgi:RNA polymerase sigma-70 factor (ECF subfamily)
VHFVPMATESRSLPELTQSAPSGEAELIRRILAGERCLFYQLIRPYERNVYLTAYAVLHHQADAEEVAQEAVLKAFSHLRELRSETTFKSWLTQIVVNEARMRRRKDRKHLYDSLDEEPAERDDEPLPAAEPRDWREIPSEILERKEIRDKVAAALAKLSEAYRVIFVMRDVEHLNVAETAAALGVSEAVVKTRLHRARLQMRELLAPVFKRRWTERLPFQKGRNPW